MTVPDPERDSRKRSKNFLVAGALVALVVLVEAADAARNGGGDPGATPGQESLDRPGMALVFQQ